MSARWRRCRSSSTVATTRRSWCTPASPGGSTTRSSRLLERLAGDVGFAIEAAGKEAARRKAERQLETLNKSLERRVRERTDALEAANAELEAFSYSVSHDLRAPLRALDGFSLALLEDYGDGLDDEAADYLARIRAASQRMARLIDDLLMLSRVTRRDMRSEQVDLSAIAGAIAADLAADDASRQVRFTVAENMVVDGDPDLLDVALRNLLGNAWKFTSRTAGAEVARRASRRRTASAGSSSATTAPGSSSSTPTSSSRRSSGCTATTSSRARGSGSRPSSASCAGTAAGSGRRAQRVKVRRCGSQ